MGEQERSVGIAGGAHAFEKLNCVSCPPSPSGGRALPAGATPSPATDHSSEPRHPRWRQRASRRYPFSITFIDIFMITRILARHPEAPLAKPVDAIAVGKLFVGHERHVTQVVQ